MYINGKVTVSGGCHQQFPIDKKLRGIYFIALSKVGWCHDTLAKQLILVVFL
jgi:hypothetical protein